MEALGAAASILTILESTSKITSFGKLVKNAPEDWKKYCDGLRRVACIQTVLENTLKTHPHIRDLPIGKDDERPFVDCINDNLSQVGNDASELLNKYRRLIPEKTTKKPNHARRILQWILKNKAALRFALTEKQVSGLVAQVEGAQHHLHLALTLASIETSASWRSQAGGLLDTIKTEIVNHGERLKELKREYPSLRQEGFDVMIDGEPSELLAVFPKGTVYGGKVCLSADPAKKSRGPRIWKSSRPMFQRNKSTGEVDHGCVTDDKPADGDEPHNLIILHAGRQDLHADGKYDTDLSHTFKGEAEELEQLPIDSTENIMVPSPVLDLDVEEKTASTVIKDDDFEASISDEEWETPDYIPIENFLELEPSSRHSAHIPDSETTEDQSPVTKHFEGQTHVFIPEGMRMASCKNEGTGKWSFCIERLSVASHGQNLCASEPCSTANNISCKHITLEVEHGSILTTSPPFKVKLASINAVKSLKDVPHEASSLQGNDIHLYPRCHIRDKCTHTVVDDASRGQAWCSRQYKFRGSPDENPTTIKGAEVVASTQSAHSKAGYCDNRGAGPSQDQGHSTGVPRFPMEPDPEDDEQAFKLLKHVILDETSHIPTSVKWDVLVRFLSLANKYDLSKDLQEKSLSQVGRWVSSLRPPKLFDNDALTWLWIMWKLQMGSEFKKLSSLVQQQARNRISRQQDESDSKHSMELPKSVLDLLDRRRLAVLWRVRNMMTCEIASKREKYLETFTQNTVHGTRSESLAFSLAYGYLQLERDRWFTQAASVGGGSEFDGVSYEDVCSSVRSMIDLDDWKVFTGSEANNKWTLPVAALSSMVPLFGPGLVWAAQEGVHWWFKEGFRNKLVKLIEEIEMEDWGIDLAHIR